MTFNYVECKVEIVSSTDNGDEFSDKELAKILQDF